MLIKKLHVGGLPTRVQFHAITGNSGGGGAVQNIYHKLMANNVMVVTRKKSNHQCHVLNKCLKTLSINTFGKQGIGQVNIFQLVYVYVKLMKSLGEHGGTEIVDEVHSLIVHHIASYDEWQSGASCHSVAFENM